LEFLIKIQTGRSALTVGRRKKVAPFGYEENPGLLLGEAKEKETKKMEGEIQRGDDTEAPGRITKKRSLSIGRTFLEEEQKEILKR